MTKLQTVGWAAVLSLAAVGSAWAQATVETQGYMTRGELEQLLERLDREASSPAYSGALRAQTRARANLIRLRLDQGDFRVGDRIFLSVENETALQDTFVVDDGLKLFLPTLDEIPLAGILRSELEPHLTQYLSRYFRDPRVRARTLIRLTFRGGVGRPGFYTVPSEAMLTDALMAAGGPIAGARLTDIRIERGGQRIWDPDPLQDAIVEGRTLDELNLRAGDQIIIPEQGGGLGAAEGTLRALTIVLSIPFTIVALSQLFNR